MPADCWGLKLTIALKLSLINIHIILRLIMKSLLFILLFSISLSAYSQNSDSLKYQIQRLKINNMLNDRSQKFGEYVNSLDRRTGIFGLKTKKDMQNSINILSDIIQTDNQILKETKLLLTFKTFEEEKLKSKKEEVETKSLGYMRSYNKLEARNTQLIAELEESTKSKNFYRLLSFFALIATIIMAVFTYRKIYK